MSTSPKLKDQVLRSDGTTDANALQTVLNVSQQELASAVGLEVGQLDSGDAQQRLSDFVDILDRVIPWTGDAASALNWFRSQVLPSFGTTAECLVKSGRASAVAAYLERTSAGGFA